jgi:hypothetical protein
MPSVAEPPIAEDEQCAAMIERRSERRRRE